MANEKITDLATITAAELAPGDPFVVVDVSDTSMSATGTNKQLPKSEVDTLYDAAGAASTAQSTAISTASADATTKANAAQAAAEATAASTYIALAGTQTATGLKNLNGGFTSRTSSTPGSGQITMKALGDTADGVVNWKHDGDAGYLFHLTGGSNFTGNALIGLGVDYAGKGLLVNNKGTGIGIRLDNWDTISDAAAFGMYGTQNSTSAPLVMLYQQKAGAAEALRLRADNTATAGQRLFTWWNSSAEMGFIDGLSGKLAVTCGLFTVGANSPTNAPLITINGATATNRGIGIQTAGVDRWRIWTHTDSEAGSSVGSSLRIDSYTDAGAFSRTMLEVGRGNQNIGLLGGTTYGGGVRVLGLANATTPPASSPTASIVMWAASEVLNVKGPAGGTTQTVDPTAFATAAQGSTADTAVQPARSISTTAPLSGGGDLSANRTLTVSSASTSAVGVVELATTAETQTGTDTGRVVTPAGLAAVVLPRAKTGLYITGTSITSTTSQARSSGQLTAVAVPIYRPTPIDRLALYVGTFATTGNLRLGIYSDDGTGFPGAIYLDAGTITATSPTNIKEITVSDTLQPGLWWFAAIHEFTGTLTVEGGTNGHAFWQYRTAPGTTYGNGFVITGQTTAGGFPGTWSGAISATLGNPSLVCARVA